MIVYHATGTRPIAVECSEPGYPNVDSNGEMMSDNTHFSTEGEAWEALRCELKAGVYLAARRVTDSRKELDQYTTYLADCTLEWVSCEREFEKWVRDLKDSE